MAAERPQSSASHWTLAGSVQRRISAIAFTVTCERTFKTRRSRHTFSVLQLSLFICARMKNCCAFVNYGAQSAEIIIVIISLEHINIAGRLSCLHCKMPTLNTYSGTILVGVCFCYYCYLLKLSTEAALVKQLELVTSTVQNVVSAPNHGLRLA